MLARIVLAFIGVYPIVAAMNRKVLLAAALASLLGSCSRDVAPKAAYMIGACENAPIGRALPAVQRVFAYHRETRAMLVLDGGCPMIKAYAPGYSDQNRFVSWSMAKTITGLLIGALVEDGKLSLDAPAPIAEWHQPGDPRATITLRQMLQMSSGLQHIEVGDPVENSDTNQTLFVDHTAAMAAAAIAHPLASKPGTTFEYSSLTTLILSEIITRTLTPSNDPRVRAAAYTRFAEDRLFRPAGIASAQMEFDGAGTQIGGSLIYMTLDDWGRLGTVLLDGRNASGVQVVDPKWLAFMKTPAATDGEYGAQLWLNRTGLNGQSSMFPGKGPDTAVAAEGHIGQYVIASPESGAGRGVVIVRLGNTPEPKMPKLVQSLGDVLKVFDRR
jgi:CubicO group peptidase (beta-lactamase class C family)